MLFVVVSIGVNSSLLLYKYEIIMHNYCYFPLFQLSTIFILFDIKLRKRSVIRNLSIYHWSTSCKLPCRRVQGAQQEANKASVQIFKSISQIKECGAVRNPECWIFNYHGDTHSVTNDRISFRGVTLTVAKVRARVCRRYRSSPPGVGAFYAGYYSDRISFDVFAVVVDKRYSCINPLKVRRVSSFSSLLDATVLITGCTIAAWSRTRNYCVTQKRKRPILATAAPDSLCNSRGTSIFIAPLLRSQSFKHRYRS